MTPAPTTDLDAIPALPAATVMLVRDAVTDGDDHDAATENVSENIEVFMLRRTAGAAFAAGFYVFPGGKVDPADGEPDIEHHCDGLDDATASAMLGVERGGLAYWVAAIRECFEESGVLLARPVGGDAASPPPRADDRARVHGGELSMLDLCRRHDLLLDTGALSYFAHWVTPRDEQPRRFDTRFFLAAAPPGQDGSHDHAETVDSGWMRPAEALARVEAGELTMMPPTISSLRLIARSASVADAQRRAVAIGRPERTMPNLIRDGTGQATAVELPDGTTIDLPR